ncbi:hypothetical protein CYJ19_02035 [Winkia neuii]|uniref:HNH endonuclease n=1 Tax=Winkia neuii TaxID=33007 RepID=A0A2I1IR26_9ACTO|nr:hypothetical protein CYJ19_02035 [Winkia neuii]
MPNTARYCTTHAHQYEARRGTTTDRGYGSKHQRLRNKLKAQVEQGKAICPRCNKPIKASEAFDLGHKDDRRFYNGLEHAHCNRSAGGTNGARQANERQRT